MSNITRRDWIIWFGGVVPAATFIACQQAGPQSPADSNIDTAPGVPITDIADNHLPHAPHSMVVPLQDVLDPPKDRQYCIMGMAAHDHIVTITAAQFMDLKAGRAVSDLSTMTQCHTHCCTTFLTGSGSGGSSCA
jgi:hypothetical protein